MTDRKTLDQMTSDDLDQLHAERDQYRAAILDIDAHATPVGLADPDDPDGNPHHYAVTVGALHRALGKVGHTAAPCTAEAAIARVRKACASVQAADQGHNPAVGWVVMRVLEAIDARLVNGAAPALASPCAGFPEQCPNPHPVPALSPYHGGGIRCGCTTPKEA